MHFKTKNTFQKEEKKAINPNEPSNEKIIAMRNIIKEDLAFRLSGARDSNTLVANEKTVK